MAEVRWRLEALADLDDAITYIEQFDRAAAQRYYAALRRLGESLTDFPNRGRPAANGARELTSVPPYVLAYRYLEPEDEVDILSIRHGRRQPRL